MTSLVVWWSELLTTNHEVPGSIPSSTMGILPCRGRIPVVTMVWVVRIRLKVETSVTRSHNSINNDWIHETDLLAGGDLTTLTAASTSAHRVPSILIADYGGEKRKKISLQSSVISIQSSVSVISHQSSIISLQSSAFSYQSSVISLSLQSSVFSHQSSVISLSHQSSVFSHQSSVISLQYSVFNHQSSVIYVRC